VRSLFASRLQKKLGNRKTQTGSLPVDKKYKINKTHANPIYLSGPCLPSTAHPGQVLGLACFIFFLFLFFVYVFSFSFAFF
jgi:hypothetical protein